MKNNLIFQYPSLYHEKNKITGFYEETRRLLLLQEFIKLLDPFFTVLTGIFLFFCVKRNSFGFFGES